MGSTPLIQESSRSRTIKIALAIVALGTLSIYGAVQISDYIRNQREELRYKSLTLEYLDPPFSTAYLMYWQIDDFSNYKRALRQQYDIANFQAFEQSYGENEDEILHFVRLRMINWLEREMIDRTEQLLQFKRRGSEEVGPFSIDLHPLPEAEFSQLVPY